MDFEQKLLTRLRQLLVEVDLSQTTERQLRKSLEAEFGTDLSGYKASIRQCVNDYLASTQAEEEEEEEEADEETDDEPPPPRAKAARGRAAAAAAPAEEKIPSGPLYILSPEMAKFVGVPKLQRTQCLKKVWEYVKANALQDGRDIRVDATLATMFESPLNGPQIMKQLSRHMVEKIEGSSLKAAAGKRKKTTKAGGEAKKPRAGGGGFSKPQPLSTLLADFLGVEYMPRAQVVKSIWAYIKDNELQDPKNKKNILCDDRLRELLGVEKFLGFGMMKYLNKHFLPMDS